MTNQSIDDFNDPGSDNPHDLGDLARSVFWPAHGSPFFVRGTLAPDQMACEHSIAEMHNGPDGTHRVRKP